MTIVNITTGPYWDESRGAAGTALIPIPNPPRVFENVAIGSSWAGSTAATLDRSVALISALSDCYIRVQAATPSSGDIGTLIRDSWTFPVTLRAGEKVWVKTI